MLGLKIFDDDKDTERFKLAHLIGRVHAWMSDIETLKDGHFMDFTAISMCMRNNAVDACMLDRLPLLKTVNGNDEPLSYVCMHIICALPNFHDHFSSGPGHLDFLDAIIPELLDLDREYGLRGELKDLELEELTFLAVLQRKNNVVDAKGGTHPVKGNRYLALQFRKATVYMPHGKQRYTLLPCRSCHRNEADAIKLKEDFFNCQMDGCTYTAKESNWDTKTKWDLFIMMPNHSCLNDYPGDGQNLRLLANSFSAACHKFFSDNGENYTHHQVDDDAMFSIGGCCESVENVNEVSAIFQMARTTS